MGRASGNNDKKKSRWRKCTKVSNKCIHERESHINYGESFRLKRSQARNDEKRG